HKQELMILDPAASDFENPEQVRMREPCRELQPSELDVGIRLVCSDQLDCNSLWVLAKDFCEEDGAMIGAADVLPQRVCSVYHLSLPLLALFKHNLAARYLGRFEHQSAPWGFFGSGRQRSGNYALSGDRVTARKGNGGLGDRATSPLSVVLTPGAVCI